MTRLFCEYCSSQIFEDDRNCPCCGGPTKNSIRKNDEYVLENFEYKAPSGNWYDNVFALAIAGGDFYIKKEKQTCELNIYALCPGETPFRPPYNDLDISSDNSKIIVIDNNGKVKAKKVSIFDNGNSVQKIFVKIKNKPTIEDSCLVTAYAWNLHFVH